MPSTDELIGTFKTLLARGFSVHNARRIVLLNFVIGSKQREWLKEALDRLVAEKEEGGGEDV